MQSSIPPGHEHFDWRLDGAFYYPYSAYLRNRFGGRVQRVSINAGFTCPNADGTLAKGGCNFCNNPSFSPSRRTRRYEIREQIDRGIEALKRRYSNIKGFIAYFQPATNTYADVDHLRALYEESLSHPEVVGLAIGTRPDCVAEDVLDLISELAQQRYVSVEYGMQTIHAESLDWMNRAHYHDSMIDAVERSRGRGFEISGHVILGIPRESHADMMETAVEVARLNLDAVKIHNLYAVKNTRLGDEVAAGEVQLMPRDEYVQTVVDFIERLPETMIIERVSGEAPPAYLIAPEWCLQKSSLRHAIEQEFKQRGSRQGSRYVAAASSDG
ncbi:TIGR01212 family radical SAM protein [Rosistilla oblonga]|uniref:TIGR01212 family radical SAM protein n=1 Tax=Rosistilla oblonga TaxID=2527990 RepID=UPI003A976844